jgi:hypothetical protein
MEINSIIKDFKAKVCEQLRVVPEGSERFRVFTPFLFEDGDHLAIVLKRDAGGWLLSDEGHTYMHLTYDLDERDFGKGTRQRIITNALSTFLVSDRNGELVSTVSNGQFGDSLYSFIQAVLRISDVTFLSRERVKSTFMEDFRQLIEASVPEGSRAFDWHDPTHDPEGLYSVDCKVDRRGKTPLLVYALPADERVSAATISLLQFERWGLEHLGVGVFENQEDVNRKVLARFSDVSDKQFSNLSTNRERLGRYLNENTVIQ